MNVLDLFSGIGGFSLGLERAGMRTVAFCETDEFCRRVLAKHWPDVPIHGDIKELNGDGISADLVCGGFPCQPFSVAGVRRGEADDRYLWPEMARVISEVRPRWVLAENVVGIDGLALDRVLSDLESLGYETAPPLEIPACAVDAPHRRQRVWIVAHAASPELRQVPPAGNECGNGKDSCQHPYCEAFSVCYEPNQCDGNDCWLARNPDRVPELSPEDAEYVADAEGGRRQQGDENTGGGGERSGPQQGAGSGGSGELDNAPSPRHVAGESQTNEPPRDETRRPQPERRGGGVGDSDSTRPLPRHEAAPPAGHRRPTEPANSPWQDAQWLDCGDGKRRRVEPRIRLLVTGLSERVAKLRALGNAVVPAVVEKIGRAIMEADK